MSKVENVTDVIELEYLQSIQDALGSIVGITTVLLDPQGLPVTQPTNLHSFCAMMQASEAGMPMCIRANEKLIEENVKTSKPAITTCPNSSLRTASVPLFLGEQFLGSWLIGQIRADDVDYALIERTAEKAGLSKEKAKENISRLPVISETEFDNVLQFLVTISQALTDMVETNAAMEKRNAELEELTEQLDKTVLAFRSFIDFTDMGAYLIDFATGEVIMCNETYKRMLGIVDDAMEDARCFRYMGYDDFCPFCPRMNLVDENDVPGEAYAWEHYNETSGTWLRITSRVITWFDGRLVMMTTFLDITDRKMEEERIAYLAYNDQRLDIPNDVKLHKDLSESEDESHMICFDVQALRKINDVYGRDAGDGLLHAIVTWVKGLVGENIELYRIEGGGFVLLERSGNEANALALAQEVYVRFDNAWDVDMEDVQQRMFAGAHVGVIRTPKGERKLAELLNTIERVLSFARKESTLILFDEKMNNDYEAHTQFEIELKACVLNSMQGFYLNYQPIVDTNTGQWVGLEALCRWESPKLGFIPPDIFIGEAEQLGLIDILSNWVLDEAIRQVKEWSLDKVPGFVLDINLSPLQLRDRELLSKVLAVLDLYDYPAEKLSLEITETSEIQFDEKTVAALKEIRDAGISLSLDDFGSGYATFSNLNNLPIDILKTDRSFMHGIESDAFLQQTIRSMVELAHAAGLITIAEGVETESQRRIMAENGVSRIQGYYYSRPLSTDALKDNLNRFKD